MIVSKKIILKHQRILSFLYRLFGGNKYRGRRGNYLCLKNAFVRRTVIDIKGKNNRIVINGEITRLKNCRVIVRGSNCTLTIGIGCNLSDVEFYIEDDNSSIEIGDYVTMGASHLAVIEGTNITVGENSLFSSGVVIRSGDSHSIIQDDNGKRINVSKNVLIESRVWCGHDVKILKGSHVYHDSVIATGAILTNSGQYFPHSLIAGVPAKVIKTNISWLAQRVD